jgi:outer membrane protein OmpA-like peptidoglycan-associated protein
MIRFFLSVIVLLSTFSLLAQQFTNEALRNVNSLYDELSPVLSGDRKTLYFTVANHPENIGGKKDPGDIWFSKWVGDQWSAPIHAGDVLNDRAYNAVAGISEDGNNLFLLSHYDKADNMAKSQGISVSENQGSGWGEPRNIYIPYFLNKSRIQAGTLSSNQKIFVFSAETYGTHGVDDLYVTFFENGKWTEAKNLGRVINTQFQELSPSLSPDGKTLYFSSNGLKGNGSFDVFKATRLDESWLNWSAPVNLEAVVNSEGRELFFRDYPQLGFSLFTSTKNSDGYGDLKIHRYDDPIILQKDTTVLAVQHTPDTVVKIVEVPRADPASNSKVVKVYGKVTNSKTGAPITASITFTGPALQNQAAASASANGYTIDVPSSQVYSIKIEAAGYISTLEKLDINTYEMQELEMNFTLQPVEVGTTVNLKNVLFAQTKTDLLPESFDELDLVISFLKTNPNVKIDLSGHTDNRGVHADNVRLSQLRVNKVKEYLVSKGIDGKRITGKGYGGVKPIASNDSEETRKMNRRVEFTIKKF